VIKVRRPDPAPIDTPTDRPATEALPDADPPPAEPVRRARLPAAPDAEEAVTRLLRQTNSELEGDASRRRRSTISHLKAAVAATVAELRVPGLPGRKPSRADRFRDDLASAMQPGPDEANPADRLDPLVLASAQRVDPASEVAPPLAEPTLAEPTAPRVLPRRVTAAAAPAAPDEADAGPTAPAAEPAGDADAFAAFADRLGATSLPDLLEAAAAYAVCVEGQAHFTRPQLMRRVADVSERYLGHREDERRGFGELLRQGRIEKVRRGQFAIPEGSRLLAEARRLGA
jgi:hypothetical protein